MMAAIKAVVKRLRVYGKFARGTSYTRYFGSQTQKASYLKRVRALESGAKASKAAQKAPTKAIKKARARKPGDVNGKATVDKLNVAQKHLKVARERVTMDRTPKTVADLKHWAAKSKSMSPKLSRRSYVISIPITSQPSSKNARAVFTPTKPATPVIKTFISNLFIFLFFLSGP